MLARLQRSWVLTLMVLSIAAGWWASQRGSPLWLAAFAALAVLNLHAWALACEFSWLRRIDPGPGVPRPTARALCKAWWGEVVTGLRVFGWRQPFRSSASPGQPHRCTWQTWRVAPSRIRLQPRPLEPVDETFAQSRRTLRGDQSGTGFRLHRSLRSCDRRRGGASRAGDFDAASGCRAQHGWLGDTRLAATARSATPRALGRDHRYAALRHLAGALRDDRKRATNARRQLLVARS